MAFALRDVGLNCFALVLGDEDVGSVFPTDDDALPWMAILREGRFPLRSVPAPFTQGTHLFASLRDLQDWLGTSAAGAPRSG